MAERSLIDVLDGLTEQLKTSTKDITTSIDKLRTEVSDLSTTLKKVFEIQVLPKKAEPKK